MDTTSRRMLDLIHTISEAYSLTVAESFSARYLLPEERLTRFREALEKAERIRQDPELFLSPYVDFLNHISDDLKHEIAKLADLQEN